MDFQTRNDDGEIHNHSTLDEAMTVARNDQTVWKISFSLPTKERVRLVKQGDAWIYEPIEFTKKYDYL